MQRKTGVKAVIIGAGSVGATIAYVMAIRTQVRELVLIDTNREKAEGEVMDISHGLPFLNDMDLYAGAYESVKDADLIIITAGANQRAGESRLDLLARNAKISRSIAGEIKRYYNGGLVLVVANPVDILTHLYQECLQLTYKHVIGAGTVLDSIRFRYLLGEKFDIDAKYIHGYIIGEHGETQFPAWSATNISGFSIEDYSRASGIRFTEDDKESIAAQTKNAAAEIITRKGATYYGIGISTSTIIESLLRPQPSVRTVSSRLHGEYGVDNLVLSVPSLISSQGIVRVLELPLPNDEHKKLHQSAEAIRRAVNQLNTL